MKKLASCKQAEALKWLFKAPERVIREAPKPSKRKRKIPKMAWYAGDEEISSKSLDSMEEKRWIKVDGAGGYVLDDEGKALAEMMLGQKVYDFRYGVERAVIRYDIDPLTMPNEDLRT